jgi:CRP-like cAMP-binding protein
VQLFDSLIHDFKESEALKHQKLFKFKDEVKYAYILLEGEVKITSSMIDE